MAATITAIITATCSASPSYSARCWGTRSREVSQEALLARQQGAPVQDAFRDLSLAEREFYFLTHLCGACFEELLFSGME